MIAAAAALTGAVLVALQLFPDWQFRSRSAAMFVAFAPYGILAWLLAIVLVLVATRRWARFWAAPLVAMLVLQSVWSSGYLPGPAPAASTSTLRIASFNTLHGQADADVAAQQLAAADPDVIVLIEVGEEFVESTPLAALLAGYPHRAGLATPRREVAINTLVVARHPLEQVGEVTQHIVLTTTTTDGRPVTMIAAHPSNMTHGLGKWRAEASRLADDVRAHIAGPLVVVGDLNTTREGATYAIITEPGLQDAAQQSGAGWRPTFGGRDGFPALIAIDHALVNDQVVANRFDTFAVPGSDHRGIVVDVSLR